MAKFPDNLPMDIHDFIESKDERKWNGSYTFVQGTDTQFGSIDKLILNKTEPNWDKEIVLSKKAIQLINELNPKPRFFVITGDMVDAFPEEGELRAKQMKDFVEVISALDPDIKLVCVPGNHDIGNIPTERSVDFYRKEFGPDFFKFWVGGVLFLVINSQYFQVPDAVPSEFDKQMQFLDELSSITPKPQHIVVLQHIPFFLSDPEEEDDQHFNIPKSNRTIFMEKLRNIGVRYIFGGHYHGNVGGFYKDVEEVITSAVGAPLREDPSGFRIVQVDEDRVTHKFIPLVETLAIQKESWNN